MLFPVGVSAGPDGPMAKNVFVANGCQVEVKWAAAEGRQTGVIAPIELTLKSLSDKELELAISMKAMGEERAQTMSRVAALNFEPVWTYSQKLRCRPEAHAETIMPGQLSSEMDLFSLVVKGEVGGLESGISLRPGIPQPETVSRLEPGL